MWHAVQGVILTLDEALVCDHSNRNYQEVLLFVAVCFYIML